MRLSDKLNFFINGKALPFDHLVAASELANFSVKAKYINNGLSLEPSCALSSPLIGAGRVFFGSHTYMNDGGYIRSDQGGVFVGRYCSIGRRVTLGAGGHSLSGLSSSPSLRGVKSRPYKVDDNVGMRSRSRIGPVTVGSDVWIGDGAVVMSGVTIGVGAVIAANAVVTKNVAPYHMVGGVPAKIIGYRFDSTVVDSLLKLEWWECGCVELNSLPLANINQFIESFNLASSTFPTLSISST